MEGERAWSFSAPAFAAPPAPPAPTSGATYLPTVWRKRKRSGKKQGRSKRHRGGGSSSGGVAAPATAAAATPPPPVASALPLLPPNPAQLAPLRCAWPHPAVLGLLAQQCWPAAGPAALLQRAVAAPRPAGPQLHWWNHMLPSLSLLHPPLPERQHLQLLATRAHSGGMAQAQALPRPNVLVGYEVRAMGGHTRTLVRCPCLGAAAFAPATFAACRLRAAGSLLRRCCLPAPLPLQRVHRPLQDDWLEMPAEVLPLWQATPLSPYAGPKALLHYLLCPQPQLVAAQRLVRVRGLAAKDGGMGCMAELPGAAWTLLLLAREGLTSGC